MPVGLLAYLHTMYWWIAGMHAESRTQASMGL